MKTISIILLQIFFVTNCVFARPEVFDATRNRHLSPELNIGQMRIKGIFERVIIAPDGGGDFKTRMRFGIPGDEIKGMLKKLGYKYIDQVESDCLVPFNTENGRLLVVLVSKNKNHAFLFREKARAINGDADESIIINLTKLYPQAGGRYREEDVGFCSFLTNQADKHAEIGLFDEYSVVVKRYNRRNLGTSLLALAIEIASERRMKELRIYNPYKTLFPLCKRLGFDFSRVSDMRLISFDLEKIAGADTPEILKNVAGEVGVVFTDIRPFYRNGSGKERGPGLLNNAVAAAESQMHFSHRKFINDLRAKGFFAEEALGKMPFDNFTKVLQIRSGHFVEQAI